MINPRRLAGQPHGSQLYSSSHSNCTGWVSVHHRTRHDVAGFIDNDQFDRVSRCPCQHYPRFHRIDCCERISDRVVLALECCLPPRVWPPRMNDAVLALASATRPPASIGCACPSVFRADTVHGRRLPSATCANPHPNRSWHELTQPLAQHHPGCGHYHHDKK
jgi:hypothetical protein